MPDFAGKVPAGAGDVMQIEALARDGCAEKLTHGVALGIFACMQRDLLLCTSLALATLAAVPIARADPTVGQHLDDSLDTVGDVASDASERADEAVSALGRKTRKIGGAAAGSIADGARSVGGSIADGTRSAAGSVADGARSLAESAGHLAERVGGGAWDGVKSAGSAVGSVVGRGADAAGGLLAALRDETRALLMYAADALDAKTRALRDSERKARWNQLSARFSLGDMPSEAVSEELRDHEYRVARLKRVHTLASEAGDDDTVGRTEALLEAEFARHKRRLTALRQKAQAKADR